MIKHIWVLICALSIAACSSQPIEKVNYYLLDPPATAGFSNDIYADKIPVFIERIVIAKHLQSTNLTMQLSNHQLYFSKTHFWAEPLQNSLPRALMADLNSNDSKYYFSNDLTLADASKKRLLINIDAFYPTADTKAILTGSYYMLELDTDNQSLAPEMYHFSIQVDLEKDGFGHAISQMRTCVRQLSEHILTHVSQ